MKFDLDKYNEYAARGFCTGIGNPVSSVCVEAADLAIQVLQEMGHTNEFEELWSKKPKQEG